MEAWIEASRYLIDGGSFHLMAHSMGCFISTHYKIRHPEQIEQMMFLSPAGISGNPPGWKFSDELKVKTC